MGEELKEQYGKDDTVLDDIVCCTKVTDAGYTTIFNFETEKVDNEEERTVIMLLCQTLAEHFDETAEYLRKCIEKLKGETDEV